MTSTKEVLAIGQTEKGVGITYRVPPYSTLHPDEWPAVTVTFAPKSLPGLTKAVMDAKEVRYSYLYERVRADGKQDPLFTHVALESPGKFTCYRIVLHDTRAKTVKPGFVLGVSFRELLQMKYRDHEAQRSKSSFDPMFLGDSPQVSAAVCGFKTVADNFVFQRFLSNIVTMDAKQLNVILASETERLRKDSVLPAQVRNRPAAVKALRDAKTASVRVAWFTIEDEVPSDHWMQSLRGSFHEILDAAGIRVVDEAADVEFAMHLKVDSIDPAKYTAGPAPGAMSLTINTKTNTEGIMLLKKGDAVVHSIPIGGGYHTPSSFTLGRGQNPIIGALRSSGFHKELLALLVEASGPEMLKPIIKEYKGFSSVSTDWGGGWTAYQSLFDVLAESHAPWAEKMLDELANDPDSSSARRLARQALEKRKGDQ